MFFQTVGNVELSSYIRYLPTAFEEFHKISKSAKLILISFEKLSFAHIHTYFYKYFSIKLVYINFWW